MWSIVVVVQQLLQADITLSPVDHLLNHPHFFTPLRPLSLRPLSLRPLSLRPLSLRFLLSLRLLLSLIFPFSLMPLVEEGGSEEWIAGKELMLSQLIFKV